MDNQPKCQNKFWKCFCRPQIYKKKKKGSLFCNFKFLQVQCLCCDNAVIMTWLGKETTWICLGNNCILAYLILAPLDGWKLSQPIVKNMNLFIHLVCQKHAWKRSRLVWNAHGFVFKSCWCETLVSGLGAFLTLLYRPTYRHESKLIYMYYKHIIEIHLTRTAWHKQTHMCPCFAEM